MANYKSRILTEDEVTLIINTIRQGYGVHNPNDEVADILLIQSNTGLKNDEILNFDTNNIISENGVNRYCVDGKKYILTDTAMSIINDIGTGRLFTIKMQSFSKHLKNAVRYLKLDNVSAESFRKYFAQKILEESRSLETVRDYMQQGELKYIL